MRQTAAVQHAPSLACGQRTPRGNMLTTRSAYKGECLMDILFAPISAQLIQLYISRTPSGDISSHPLDFDSTFDSIPFGNSAPLPTPSLLKRSTAKFALSSTTTRFATFVARHLRPRHALIAPLSISRRVAPIDNPFFRVICRKCPVVKESLLAEARLLPRMLRGKAPSLTARKPVCR